MTSDEFMDPTDSVAVPRKTARAPQHPRRQGDHPSRHLQGQGRSPLDRVEELIRERAKPKADLAKKKPTFARPAPEDLRAEILKTTTRRSRRSPTEGPAQRAVCTTACFRGSGLPAATVISTEFAKAARAQARALGLTTTRPSWWRIRSSR
jgi:hypothetical protein